MRTASPADEGWRRGGGGEEGAPITAQVTAGSGVAVATTSSNLNFALFFTHQVFACISLQLESGALRQQFLPPVATLCLCNDPLLSSKPFSSVSLQLLLIHSATIKFSLKLLQIITLY